MISFLLDNLAYSGRVVSAALTAMTGQLVDSDQLGLVVRINGRTEWFQVVVLESGEESGVLLLLVTAGVTRWSWSMGVGDSLQTSVTLEDVVNASVIGKASSSRKLNRKIGWLE